MVAWILGVFQFAPVIYVHLRACAPGGADEQFSGIEKEENKRCFAILSSYSSFPTTVHHQTSPTPASLKYGRVAHAHIL